jgi:L-rhamnose mutarotase
MQRFALTVDLKDDPAAIAAYEAYHRAVWPEILDSLRASGVEDLRIYRLGNRLFMLLEANDAFTFEQKAALDEANPKVQEWEQLMWQFQQALPQTPPGQKWLWLRMEEIFALRDC